MPRLNPQTWKCDDCGAEIPIGEAKSPPAPVKGGDPTRQALCNDCYLKHFDDVYPGEPLNG